MALSVSPASAQTAAAKPDPSVKITGEYGPTGLTLASKEGKDIDDLINIMHIFMAVIFVGWGLFFVYCLVKFRQRSDHRANPIPIKAKVSKYSEIGVAMFEAAILVGFSIPIWRTARGEPPKAQDNPVHVRVVAEQFAWNFHYPGADGKFGRTDPRLVNTATNVLGVDRTDPAAADDVVHGELHLPVGRPAICEITAKDVIHSFFLPVMRVKQDAMPGMRIPVWFTPTLEGVYEVACAQLCGNNHYSMRAVMYVESQQKVDAWMAERLKPQEAFED
jgi:cytochrome c oxidase subunit 2